MTMPSTVVATHVVAVAIVAVHVLIVAIAVRMVVLRGGGRRSDEPGGENGRGGQ